MKTITAKQLRQNAGEILHSIHMLGEEFTITMSGKPVAMLVPLHGIPVMASAESPATAHQTPGKSHCAKAGA